MMMASGHFFSFSDQPGRRGESVITRPRYRLAVAVVRCLRGHPYMTSALRGEGGLASKEDVVREVA